MASYNKGFMGPFSGKLGPAVGSSWRNKSILRSLPAFKKNRKSSQQQTEHKAKFNMAIQFAKMFEGLVNETFQSVPQNESAVNGLLRQVIKETVTGAYPDFTIDYSKVKLATGSWRVAGNPSAASIAPGILEFNWENNSGGTQAFGNDKAILIAYCPELNEVVYSMQNGTRLDGTGQLNLSFLSGKQVQTWIAFRSIDGKKISYSSYLGAVLVA